MSRFGSVFAPESGCCRCLSAASYPDELKLPYETIVAAYDQTPCWMDAAGTPL